MGIGLVATGPRSSLGYWPGCYRPQADLGVLAWLLQAPGWPGGTGLAAADPRLAWGTGLAATRVAGLPGDTDLAAAAHRGFRQGCCSPQDSMGVPMLAWGYRPG